VSTIVIVNSDTPLRSLVVKTQQNRIFQTLFNLTFLPNVTVENEYKGESNVISAIYIKHSQEYVPNLVLRWCPVKEYFRVYIHVADSTTEKKNAGYCICTIGSGLSATGLAMMYSFIHKNRANNRTEAKE
jgi:hypothetical protein